MKSRILYYSSASFFLLPAHVLKCTNWPEEARARTPRRTLLPLLSPLGWFTTGLSIISFFYFLVPFLVSGTFNSPFERLFTFLSQYFFAIGFSYIFRFWRNIPPLLLLLVTQIHYKIPIIATLKKSNIVCDDPKRITRLSLSLTDFFQNQLFFRLLPPPQLIFLKLQRATPSQCGAVLLILIFFIFARRY